MSKPRTFVSSTCYDLADARASIKEYLANLGHEPILSDDLQFGVSVGDHSHQACLVQVELADYLVLVVGGRFGGNFIGSERSITNEEWRAAVRLGMPIFVFVKDEVETAAQVYRKNPKADLTDYVDDVRIFDFVATIKAQSEDNWVRRFRNAQDIIDGLRAQFAFVHGQFSRELRRRRSPQARSSKATEATPYPGGPCRARR